MKTKLNIEAAFWGYTEEYQDGDIEEGVAFSISHAGERGKPMHLAGVSVDQTARICDDIMNEIADGMLRSGGSDVAPRSLSVSTDDEPEEIVIRIRRLKRAPAGVESGR